MLSTWPAKFVRGLIASTVTATSYSNESAMGSTLSSLAEQPLYLNATSNAHISLSATQSRPLVQVLAIGNMPNLASAPGSRSMTINNKAIAPGCSMTTIASANSVRTTRTCWPGVRVQPSFGGAPMTITRVDSVPGQAPTTIVETAVAEATLSTPPDDSKEADWKFDLSDSFVDEVIRLANDQCHRAGITKRQFVDPSVMLCMPGQLPAANLLDLKESISRYAYSEISFQDSAADNWKSNEFGEEENRIGAATMLQLGIMDILEKTGGYLNGELVVAPKVASLWLSSALVSRTNPDRYWDFHSKTSSALITSSSTSSVKAPSKSTSAEEDGSISIENEDESATSSMTVNCPWCTGTACAVSPDDDQGQDGIYIPIRPVIVTRAEEPLCIPMQDENDQAWKCMCKFPKYPNPDGGFGDITTSWTTFLTASSSMTALVSGPCLYTSLPPTFPFYRPEKYSRLCNLVQDAHTDGQGICLCQKPTDKLEIHSTSWSAYVTHRGPSANMVYDACAYSDLPAVPIPDTQTSVPTCRATSVAGQSPSPFGAQATALESAILTFCQHYSQLNLRKEVPFTAFENPPKNDHPWNGRIRTKDYAYSTPAAVNALDKSGKVITVVRLSIKYEVKACDDPNKPVQSQFDLDAGNWCQTEMKRVVSQCSPFDSNGAKYYPGGEVYAGCIKFGVEHVTKKGKVGELKMIE